MSDARMELLAPAGDMDALRAAVQNGADAVYLGTGTFNARRHAGNFDGDGLNEAVAYCHARGVKVHVTVNTLVRQDELEALFDTIRQVNMSGADAVIVQDFGAARAIRTIAPDVALHASTQMAAHNVQAARFLRAQGFDRVVLAREATFDDMAACAAAGIETEVFVHGALCVACSGQCLMSSLVGGRSGNRGLCAQPCRLPWRLDGREGYLLSTRDLCALDDLPRLRQAGVASLKIEGRLKRAEYVAVTVAAYRRALNALYAGETLDTDALREDLKQMFNRGGFTRGYGPGMEERTLMYPQRPNHIGVPVGRATRRGEVALDAPVDPADALVLRRGDEDVPVRLSGGAGERAVCPKARPGDALVRLVSEVQMKRARDSFDGERRARPVSMQAALKVGEPARLTVTDGVHTAEARGDVLQPASLLNALRRDALAALEANYTRVWRENRPIELPVLPGEQSDRPLLYAQSADPEVLQRALACGADMTVYCPNDLRPEGSLFAGVQLPERFVLCVPAVLTAEALDGLNAWANANADRVAGTILENVGHFGLRWPGARIGGYMLNAANDLTVAQLNAWGMETVTPSVELTAAQTAAMGGRRHLIMWGRVPLMRLRHCPLRAARGMRGRHADCRHCDVCAPEDRLEGRALVDRKNAAFPLRRIAMPGGCVIQVMNSVPLMPLKRLDRLPAASGWRLLLDPADPVEAVVRTCRAAIDGWDFKALPEWKTLEALDTTAGHYFRGVE